MARENRISEALVIFQKVLTLKFLPATFCNLFFSQQRICDWENRERQLKNLKELIIQERNCSLLVLIKPLHALEYPLALDELHSISHCHSIGTMQKIKELGWQPYYNEESNAEFDSVRKHYESKLSSLIGLSPIGTKRLRVGYVSSDFGNHPVGHLISSLFAHHNKTNFEVFCYALSGDDGSRWRKKISSEAEHFIDISKLSVPEAFSRIVTDDIDILVDLNGYTLGERSEIFALQPAPIQVLLLGYAGTMGAPWMNYLVTDEIATPPEHAQPQFYSEKFLYMPHSFLVNDHLNLFPDALQLNWDKNPEERAIQRQKLKLPRNEQEPFLFACFSQLHKIDPEIFSVWMSILKRVPNSILWLPKSPKHAMDNIIKYAKQQGIDSRKRLCFASEFPFDEHIKMKSLADLALDTPSYNGHSTGLDTLLSGVPMISLIGQKMASRVGASILTAIGLGKELIVNDLQSYEEKAVQLATTHQSQLQEIRKTLRANRLSQPLFNIELWVRHFEKGLLLMFEHEFSKQSAGNSTRIIRIPEIKETEKNLESSSLIEVSAENFNE